MIEIPQTIYSLYNQNVKVPLKGQSSKIPFRLLQQ